MKEHSIENIHKIMLEHGYSKCPFCFEELHQEIFWNTINEKPDLNCEKYSC